MPATTAKQRVDHRAALTSFGMPNDSRFSATISPAFTGSMTDNPGLLPSYVLMADVNVDRNFRKDIKDVVAQLSNITEGLLDAELLANSDNFMAYTAYYNSVKMAAKRGVPGADAELAKLQPFFPTGRRTAQPAAKTTPH